MPSIGRCSFLQNLRLLKHIIRKCVNALNRAMLISTLWVVSGLRSGIGCQCPQSGDAHFYIILGLVFVLAGACVNALNRAMLISTEVKGNEKTSIGSVNALNRAMLISTNPQSGDAHFYKGQRIAVVKGLKLCQCPQSGDAHFYPALLELAYLAA